MQESKENALPMAKVQKGAWLTWAWLAPLVALLVAGWMWYDWHRSAGPVITIQFTDGSGLRAGQSMVRFRGVVAGEVRDIRLTPDLQQVEVEVRMRASAKELCREGSSFWIVRPQVSLTEISGLETIISGPYIQAAAGKGDKAHRFRGLAAPPVAGDRDGALRITLVTDRLNSAGAGSGISYRGVKVGTVLSAALSPDAQRVFLEARIEAPYRPLIREGTQFWNEAGIGVSFRWLKAEVDLQSLKGLLEGSIAMATPEIEEAGPIVDDGAHFLLHEELDEEWLEWAPSVAVETNARRASDIQENSEAQSEPEVNDRDELR